MATEDQDQGIQPVGELHRDKHMTMSHDHHMTMSHDHHMTMSHDHHKTTPHGWVFPYPP